MKKLIKPDTSQKNKKSIDEYDCQPAKVSQSYPYYTRDKIFSKKSTNFYTFQKSIDDVDISFKQTAINKIKLLNNQSIKLFSEDYNENASKKFIGASYDIMYYISSTYETCFYENFEENDNIKLFVDIDINKEHFTEDNKNTIFDSFVNKILKYFESAIFKKLDIEKYSYILLKSENRPEKLSGHLIFTNIVFRNIYCIKYMLMDNHNELINNKILDISVYKVGCLRMMNSCKFGKKNKLIFYKSHNYTYINDKTVFLDSLVCNINKNVKIYDYKYEDKIKLNYNPKSKIQKQLSQFSIIENYPIALLKSFVDLLDKKRSDEYDSWLKIGISIYNSNNSIDAFNLWNTWSQISIKYDKNSCIYVWNSFKGKQYNISIGTLKYYSRLDNPIKFFELKNEYQDKQLFETIDINVKYISHYNKIEQIINDNKCTGIKSPCGTGKTHFLLNYIETYKPETILFITYRQTLSHNLFGNFKKYGFEIYLNKTTCYDRYICQIESLHKLTYSNCFTKSINIPQYDLIILDECESILNHFDSPTIKNKNTTFNIFNGLIKKANKIIALDGDFHNRSYTFLKTVVGHDFKIVQNLYKDTFYDFKFTNDLVKFDKSIDEDLNKNLKLFICSMSSTIALKYYEKFCKLGLKAIVHCSKSDDSQKKLLNDVNNYWIVSVVLISPSIESGVDFNVEYFDKIYIILSNLSTSQRGLMQMIHRVRKFKCHEIHTFLNGLPYDETGNFYSLDDVENMYNNILQVNNNTVLDEKCDLVYLNDTLLTISKYNFLESLNKNKSLFIPYLLKILKEKCHTFSFDKTKCKTKIDKINIMKEHILNAPDCNEDEFKFLMLKQSNNIATLEDKFIIEKYLYKFYWNVDNITEEFLNKNYRKIHVLFNYNSLINRNLKTYDTMDDDYRDIELIIKKKKLITIKELLLILGFKNCLDKISINKISINKIEFDKNKNICIKKCKIFTNKDILTLFKMNKKTITSMKSFLGFVNSILSNYGIKINYERIGSHKQNFFAYNLIKII